MNIFSSLVVYAGKWNLKASRNFEREEIAAVVGGGQTFIPLSSDSTLTVGDIVDLSKAKLLTLEKDGESDILRVKA